MVINPRPTTLVANAIFDSQSDENNGPRRSTRASAGINPHLDEMYNTQAPPLEPVVRRSRNRSPSMFSDNPCSTHVFRVHPNRKPPASPSEKKLGDRRGRPPSASKDPGDVNDLHEALDELRRRPTVRRPRPTSTTEVSPAHHTTSAVSTTIKAQVGISWDGEVDSAIVQWDKQNWSPHGPVPVVHATAAAALPN